MPEESQIEPVAQPLTAGSLSASVVTEPVAPGAAASKVTIDGELDLASAGPLKDVLMRELSEGRDVVLDMSQVTFIDSTGLAAIVAASNHAKRANRSLKLSSALQAQPLRLMELTQVLQTLDLTSD